MSSFSCHNNCNGFLICVASLFDVSFNGVGYLVIIRDQWIGHGPGDFDSLSVSIISLISCRLVGEIRKELGTLDFR